MNIQESPTLHPQTRSGQELDQGGTMLNLSSNPSLVNLPIHALLLDLDLFRIRLCPLSAGDTSNPFISCETSKRTSSHEGTGGQDSITFLVSPRNTFPELFTQPAFQTQRLSTKYLLQSSQTSHRFSKLLWLHTPRSRVHGSQSSKP